MKFENPDKCTVLLQSERNFLLPLLVGKRFDPKAANVWIWGGIVVGVALKQNLQ